MPQEFNVLCCYKCNMFQVQQVKKVTKWICKMCGEKQSLKKVYFKGRGPECRENVQKMNLMKGQISEEKARNCEENKTSKELEHFEADKNTSHGTTDIKESTCVVKSNKWEKYLNTKEEEEEKDDLEDEEEDNFFWEKPKQKGKKRKLTTQQIESIEPRSHFEVSKQNMYLGNQSKSCFHQIRKESKSEVYACDEPRHLLSSGLYTDSAKRTKHDDGSNQFHNQTAGQGQMVSRNVDNFSVRSLGQNENRKLTKYCNSSLNTCNTLREKNPNNDLHAAECSSSKWGKYLQLEEKTYDTDSDY